jgi:hypothetical protein
MVRAGIQALTTVPLPAVLVSSNVPPASSARSRMLFRPTWSSSVTLAESRAVDQAQGHALGRPAPI